MIRIGIRMPGGNRFGKWIFFFCFLFFLSVQGRCGEPFTPNSTLTLDDCEAVALKYQPSLIAAEHDVNAFFSHVGASRADYWPQISFASDYLRGNYQAIQGPLSSIFTGVFTLYDANFNARLTLMDFGARYARVGQAKAQLAQALARYHDTKGTVIFNVAQAYFKLLESQSLEKMDEDLLAAAGKHLELAKGFVKTGEKSMLELLKAQTVFYTAEYNLLKSRSDRQSALTRLSAAMGIENPPPYHLVGEISTPAFHVSLMQAKAAAFRNKPRILLARQEVEEARGKLHELHAGRFPTLTAVGSYGWVDQVFPPQPIAWQLGMTLSWPIFQGNKLTYEINEANERVKNLLEEENNLVLQVNGEVEENYRAFENAVERLRVAGDEVKEAAEAFHLAGLRYKVGLASILELSDAEANLSQAQSHQVSAMSDYRISQSALKRSMGIESP